MTNTTHPTTELRELKRLAEAATPYDTFTFTNEDDLRNDNFFLGEADHDPEHGSGMTSMLEGGLCLADDDQNANNAAFIAAANPTTVLALLGRIEELETENFKLAAGQCAVEGGLVGDEYGNQVCTLTAQVSQLREALGDIASQAEFVRNDYERNGPELTDIGTGTELYSAGYVLAKCDEIARRARTAGGEDG